MVELSLAHLFDVFGRYGETARDFLVRLRPRRFAQAVRANPAAYVQPFHFAATSLIISAVCAFTMAAFILAAPERETLFHINVWGCLAIVVFVWLENLYLVIAAKLSAFALGVSATMSDLLDGYCYASVLFPLLVIAAAPVVLAPHDIDMEPFVPAYVIVSLLFLGVASVAMISFAGLHPRYAWRACVGTTLLVLIGGVAVLAAIEKIVDKMTEPTGYETHPIDSALSSLAANLIPSRSTPVPCDNMLVTGYIQPNGEETTAWFEYGETPYLERITAPQKFTADSHIEARLTNLKPNTTYYFALVGWSKFGSLKDRPKSFRTGSFDAKRCK